MIGLKGGPSQPRSRASRTRLRATLCTFRIGSSVGENARTEGLVHLYSVLGCHFNRASVGRRGTAQQPVIRVGRSDVRRAGAQWRTKPNSVARVWGEPGANDLAAKRPKGRVGMPAVERGAR